MNTNPKWYIPGIVSIKTVDLGGLLRDILKRDDAGLPVAVFCAASNVDFYDTPVCEVESVNAVSGTDSTTTLQFVTDVDFTIGPGVGFIIEDVDGVSRLIGVYEQPWPTVEIKSTTGKTDGHRVGECKVTWPHAPVEIIDDSFME